jgi:hypothetical protein
MAHDWILGLLSDLAVYARKNGLSATAEACEALRNVALRDISGHRAGRDECESMPPGNRRH